MGLHEFMRELIVSNMEDNKTRDKKAHEYLVHKLQIAKRLYVWPSAVPATVWMLQSGNESPIHD